MLSFLIKKYKNSKGLFHYFVLTYLDKIISFALPLSILFIIKDKELYSFVEVSYSYATLAMIIIELGVSNYLFFGYKNAADKELFLLGAKVNFKFLIFIYATLSIPLFISIYVINPLVLELYLLVGVRTLFTFYLNFYSNIYRLRDNPSGIYLTSILVNVFSFACIVLATYFDIGNKIYFFFLPSATLILGVVLRFLILEVTLVKLQNFYDFLKKALHFSWPIILNVLAMSFMNNYAKIYAYQHLSQDQMIQISFIMRLGIIIQLTHTSFASYFSKSIFMDDSQKLNFRIFRNYNIVLIGAAFLVVFAFFVTNILFKHEVQIPFSISTLLLLLYIVLWCYIGYLEIYFGIKNANRKILYYSLIASLIYILLIKFGGEISIFQLSLFMVISAIVNLLLVLKGLHELQIINVRKRI